MGLRQQYFLIPTVWIHIDSKRKINQVIVYFLNRILYRWDKPIELRTGLCVGCEEGE